MIRRYLTRAAEELEDEKQRALARQEIVAQTKWIRAEMEQTAPGDGERIQVLDSLLQELVQIFETLEHKWPESWEETGPPDAKERIRHLDTRREIRARADAAWARGFLERTGGTVPTKPAPRECR